MTAELPAVLAVDGGNSKTDVALVAADGSLLGTATGPGMRSASALQIWLAGLAGLIAAVQQQAGRDGLPVAAHLSACVANADLPEEEERLAAALAERGWGSTVTAANDTFAVLRAGLDGTVQASTGPQAGTVPWGVAVTCGAGINCVGVAPSGQTTRFLSLGPISGDWGGGHGLGVEALWHAVRAEDGRGPATALTGAVSAHFGVRTATEVTLGIHLGRFKEYALTGLAPVLLAVARDGDPVAADLVRRQATEICTMALTAMRKLGLAGLATPVVLGGGLLMARDPLLIAGVTEGIAAGAPHATVRVVDVPPVAGAALLGLDQAGLAATAEPRLRAAYRSAAGKTGAAGAASNGAQELTRSGPAGGTERS
ncbi:MAG TPA: BadF/BadG/BcrA/BcrD ATPase family protein [Streptosporangiaceae bacterium]|nr:BadF/BadG/BcrA/BcrD ATPase family protein [Streptosporangiaceae bacterium]